MALTKLRSTGIAANAITAAAIAPGAVEITDIADAAITTAKIADANVTSAKLNINADLNLNSSNVLNSGLKVENVISTSNVITLNYSNATVFTCVATEQANILLSEFPQDGIALLKLTNGGDHVIGFSGNSFFAAGTPPTLTASGLDYLYFEGNAAGYLVTTVANIVEA